MRYLWHFTVITCLSAIRTDLYLFIYKSLVPVGLTSSHKTLDTLFLNKDVFRYLKGLSSVIGKQNLGSYTRKSMTTAVHSGGFVPKNLKVFIAMSRNLHSFYISISAIVLCISFPWLLQQISKIMMV